MRIALDSSVLIAAHISRAGVCAELLEDLLLHHELVTSEFILEELRRMLLEKFRFPKREAHQVATFLRRAAVVVVPADLPSDACRDPTDIPVLGTAVGGECTLLICSTCIVSMTSQLSVLANIGDALPRSGRARDFLDYCGCRQPSV